MIPIREFKTKIAKWLKSIQKTRQSIIMQNGKPAGVLLSPQEYAELVYKKSFLLSLTRGIDDAEKGSLFTTEEVMAPLSETIPGE